MTNRRNRRARHKRAKARIKHRNALMRGAQAMELLAPHVRMTMRWVPLDEWLRRKRKARP